jgi:hypothetical protein
LKIVETPQSNAWAGEITLIDGTGVGWGVGFEVGWMKCRK